MKRSSINNLIRQYCDGELNDEQIAQAELHLQNHPEDQALVESERKLRQRIEAVIKTDCPHAPTELADKIKAEFAKHDVSSDSQEQTYAYSPRSWSFGPSKANVFAVAASLALVVGAVLFGIFGNPIDMRGVDKRLQAAEVTDAAESVGLEHINVASNKIPLKEMNLKGCISCKSTLSACCIKLGTHKVPEIILSSVGYEFSGGLECVVPHCDMSYHLFFKKVNGIGLVSIHVVKDTGKFNLDEGEPFESKMPFSFKTSSFYMKKEIRGGKPSVVVFGDGEFMYLVMACIPYDTEQVIGSIQASIVDQDR